MDRPEIKVFISYAHDDGPFFTVFEKTLRTQLKTRKKFRYIIWNDSKIHVGSLWDTSIKEEIENCHMAIFCISDSFLASDYIQEKEFGDLIKRYDQILMAPFLLSPCEFQDWAALAERQIFKPRGDKYDEATNDDFTFADLVRFNKKDGNLIPNVNVDRYVKDFISKFEEALEVWKKIAAPAQTIIDQPSSNYITNNFPVFKKENFFGREELLAEVDSNLKQAQLPLLLSGIGGVGKTSVALAYTSFPQYRNTYDHIAWVEAGENIFSSLFNSFAGNTMVRFEYNVGDHNKNIASLMQLFKQLPGNNLLVLNDANNEADLHQLIAAWKRYQPGWKCLVTTRCDNDTYQDHMVKIEQVPLETAKELFKSFNDESFDDASFKQVYEFTGGHPLATELLAKFAQQNKSVNSTAEILDHLKDSQITSGKKLRNFVDRILDPLLITENQQKYLRYFSVLPASDIELNKLTHLFGIKEEDEAGFNDELNLLVKQGWLMRSVNNFKCQQVIQELCREKLRPDAENCRVLILNLRFLFETTTATLSAPYFEIAASVVNSIKAIDFDYARMQSYFSDRAIETGDLTGGLSLLNNVKDIYIQLGEKNRVAITYKRMGEIYQMLGKTAEAIQCYQEDVLMTKQLATEQPDNIEYKNGLAVAYSMLGNISKEQGQAAKAMEYYSQYNLLEKELSEANPGNQRYKHNFAVSFSKLGDLYFGEKKTAEAMKHYQLYADITKELVNTNPENLVYKSNLGASYKRLGDVCLAHGQTESALNYYEHYTAIAKELLEKNAENLKFKNDLAVSYLKIAATGTETKTYYNKAKEILEDLVIKAPQHAEFNKNLEFVINKINNLQ